MHGGHEPKKLLSLAGLLLACSVVALLPVVPVWAQAGWVGIADVNHPGGLMRLRVATPQPVMVGDQFWIRPAGRFQLLSGQSAPIGGDPTRTGDENRAICSRPFIGTNNFVGFTSALQFSVDQTAAEAAGVLFDVYTAMDQAPAEDLAADVLNYWVAPLTTTARGATGTCLIPITDQGLAGETLRAYQNFQLVGDALMIEVVVTNTTANAHSVGVRLALDTGFGGVATRDGTSVILPDRTALTSERVLPDPQVSGGSMPASWVSFDDPANPLVSVKGVLDAQEVHLPGFANSAAGVPDALEIGLWSNISTAGFGFVPNPAMAITGEDWGIGVKWNEETLAAGASRRYVTYIAFGASVANYDSPFATMSYGPWRLQQAVGDDPATPDVTESYHYTDGQGRSPFPMSIWVDNFGPATLYGATASINPPEGLMLSPDTQSRLQSLGIIPHNTLLGATWTLSAAGARPGTVTVGLSGPRGRVVDRRIYIPAVPVINPRPSVNGLEMISIPYEFTNNDAEHVFESLGGLQPGQLGSLIRWNPLSLSYRWFPDPFVTNVQVGAGYWLLNRAAVQIVLPADAQPLPLDAPVTLSLSRGWNQIGNPFIFPVQFDTCEVVTPYGSQVSMQEAIGQGLLQPTVFDYNPTTREYEWQEELSQVRLDPYVGYWILAYADIGLVVSPPGALGATSAPAAAPSASAKPGDWRAAVVLSRAGQAPAVRTFGVAAGARDEVDARDIVAPPSPMGAKVQAAFVEASGTGAARLVDLKASGSQEKVWCLQVTASSPQRDLALSWPDLSEVPSDLVLVLEDAATGGRYYMRTTAKYRFDMPEGGTRLFKIIAQPKSAVTPLITGAQAQAVAGGNYALTFALAAPAALEVQIRNIAGVVIRRLVAGQAFPAGANTVLWNGRSDNGTRVPAGRYLCEISARSPESGQASSTIAAFAVTR